MSERILIAIAVSKPDGLEFVPGAAPSAKRLIGWAATQGYKTYLVDDEAGRTPVDTDLLCKVFVEALDGGGQDRMIVAFMGHGVFRDGAEEFWLLTRWRTETKGAVNIVKLRDRLATYKLGQLAIISDACRSLPIAKARYIDGNGVVPIRDYEPAGVQYADFFGTQAAQPAYSEPQPLSETEAHCFFSRVLTDVLLGQNQDAIEQDPVLGAVVRNDGLINQVEHELPRLATRYRRSQIPDMRGSWRAPRNVWSEIGRVGAQIPSEVLPPVPLAPQGQRTFGLSSPALQIKALKAAAEAEAARIDAASRPTHFESETGLAIAGVEVRGVTASARFIVEVVERPDWFRVTPPERPSSTAFAAELATGAWAGGALVSGYICAVGVSDGGVESVVMRPSSDGQSPAPSAIGRMISGQTIGEIEDVATALREGPAADPVLAALAAYAFERAGASEALAELVGRYAAEQTPMPFDLALVCRLPLSRAATGLRAEVNDAVIAVAGSFPWLRQGWARVDDDRRELVRRLADFAMPGPDRGLVASPFTTFQSATGADIARRIATGDL